MRSIVLLAYNLLRLLTWPVWALWRARPWALGKKQRRWVVLHLRGDLEELPRAQKRFMRLLTGMRAPRRTVAEIRRLCERIADDSAVHGLLLRLEPLAAGYATLSSLRSELMRLRARGKQVVCYVPMEASQRELYVAAAADRVLAMPHAGFSALGPLAARTYLGGLLTRLGVRVVVTAEGRYKSAADGLTRESMSEPEREQLQAIVRVLHRTWIQALGQRRLALSAGAEGAGQLGEARATALLDAGLFGAERARELGAIDELAYDDELPARLGLGVGETPVAHESYLRRAAPRARVLVPLRKRAKVVVVRLVGAISERGGGAANPGIDLHGTIATLRALADARSVAGVILHIDSPGGSAVVSELLHREIVRLDAKKPVVTWMGDVAASGGYYLASATRAIIAQPTTLTGSIGVISVRPVAERLFAKLGISRDAVSLTPFADLNSFAHGPSVPEEALLRAETARFYERFLAIVATGRKRSREQIAALAEGRVWSGYDAHAQGLVDVLGGYAEARSALDSLLPATVGAVDVAPLIISPTQKRRPALPPISTPTNAALLQQLEQLREPPGLGGELAELSALRELWQLAVSGERAFAYAIGLPRLG